MDEKRQGQEAKQGPEASLLRDPQDSHSGTRRVALGQPSPTDSLHGTSVAFALSLTDNDCLPKGCVQGARSCASTWARPRVTPRSSGTRPEGSATPAANACGHTRSPPVLADVSRRTILPRWKKLCAFLLPWTRFWCSCFPCERRHSAQHKSRRKQCVFF